VTFWRRTSSHDHDVVGAEDVHAVIEWADVEAKRRDSTYTLFAKVDRGDDRGLVWLAGIDPTVHSRPNFAREHPGA
jgi:hypothetical protein